MTIECVDGQMATPHITGAQKGAMHAGVVGDGCYVLATGNKCKATQNSATSVTIGTGDLFIHGRHHQITAAETVTIQSGTQGQKRNDLICAVYHRDAQGIEQPTVTVLKGTPTTGTPADPTVPAGNVLNGDAVDYFPLYRVSLNGTTASAPVQLFKVLPTLASLGDSVSHPLDTGWVFLYNDTTWGSVKYRARAGVCCLIISSLGGIGAGASWEIPNAIARKFLPSGGLYVPLAHRQKGDVAQVWIPGQNDVNSNGKLYIYSNMDTDDKFSRISGIVTWIYEPEPAGPEA